MRNLVIDNVSHWFGSHQALKSISLEVKKSELIALLGPSGCGKTTLLRMIAGFIPTQHGQILLSGSRISDAPAYKRNTGMVFQSYALFPHMTVAQNVGFGLEMRKVRAAQARQRVAEALRMVRLEGFGDRYPKQLSGGQQQRVAIARALVVEPEAFLLDEPLSNLDAKLRYSVGQEIRSLQKSLGLTTIFVTHDQNEALALADRLVVMDRGAIVQTGSAEELYARPANSFVANFIGHANLLDGKVDAVDRFAVDGVALTCRTDAPVGTKKKLCIRPEKIAFEKTEQNCLQSKVDSVTYLGSTTEIVVRPVNMARTITVHHQNHANKAFIPDVGSEVFISWLPESGMLLTVEDAADALSRGTPLN